MAGFFSLQPQPENQSNLSQFSSGLPSLEHVGGSHEYLDPSLTGGETLHSPFEEQTGNTDTSGARPQGSNLMAPTGDTSGAVSPTGGVSITGARTPVQAPTSKGGSTLPSGMAPAQSQTLQALGTAQKAISQVPDSLINSVKSTLTDKYKITSDQADQLISSLGQDDLFKLSGALEGNYSPEESLNPTATEGYTLGAGNLDTAWLNDYVTGTKTSASTPSLFDKFGKSDIQGALGVAQASVSGDPGAILSSLNKIAPNVAKYITDNKEAISQVGNVSQALGGAYSLFQGIQSNDPTKIAQGIGSLLTGAGNTIGLETISQATGVSTQALTGAFGALGGVTGAMGLIQGIQNGDPMQAILGAGAVYGALSTVAPTVFAPLSGLALSALSAVAPGVAAAISGAVGGATGAIAAAGAATAAAGAATGSAAGAAIGGAVAAAPLAVVLAPILIVAIWGAFDPEAPQLSDIWTGGKLDPYYKFAGKLTENEGRQGEAFSTFEQALPYVQSQQELQGLIAAFKKHMSIGNEDLAQFMTQDPWSVSAIPDAGAVTHGMKTTPTNWGSQVEQTNALINKLRNALPPTGGSDASTLWNTVLTNNANQREIRYGLNLNNLGMMDPYAAGETLSRYKDPISTGAISPEFAKLFPGYQAPTMTDLSYYRKLYPYTPYTTTAPSPEAPSSAFTPTSITGGRDPYLDALYYQQFTSGGG